MEYQPRKTASGIAPRPEGTKMRKTIFLVLLSVSLLFTASASSCSSGIDKSQYDKAVQELTVLREKKTKAEMYALFLDLLMSQFFKQANVPSRFQFNTVEEWGRALDTMATTINDSQLTALIAKMKKDATAVFEVQSYVINQIATALK